MIAFDGQKLDTEILRVINFCLDKLKENLKRAKGCILPII